MDWLNRYALPDIEEHEQDGVVPVFRLNSKTLSYLKITEEFQN